MAFGALVLSASWGLASCDSPESAPDAESYDAEVAHKPMLFTRADVAKHNSPATRIWVTYRDGVYDVTDFVSLHPGGDKILLAAGSAVDPFWMIYQQHKGLHVIEILERYRIGNLDPADAAAIRSAIAAVGDPYSNDPARSPLLHARSSKPFNGEPPTALLVDAYVTPADLLFVRNHLPVPDVDPAAFRLRIEGPGLPNGGASLTLEELRTRFKRVEVVAALQCAGNRRGEMGPRFDSTAVRGLSWDVAAMGNLRWAGARLRDVLLYAGVREEDVGRAIHHVQFEGLDRDPATGSAYAASIPADKALDPRGDVLLAYEMNGAPIPRDHGFPLRAVVPGITGARQVKWLGKIVLSDVEADSLWQRKDYKAFAPYVNWDNVDFSSMPAIQEMPVTSAICEPREGAVLPPGSGTVTVKGFAWSGGGRRISRVDVSADGGVSWHPTEFTERPADSSPSHTRSWGWTTWSAEVPLPPPSGASSGAYSEGGPAIGGTPCPDASSAELELVCKAVDSSYNAQPERPAGIWNFRGLLSNAWHRVHVIRHSGAASPPSQAVSGQAGLPGAEVAVASAEGTGVVGAQ